MTSKNENTHFPVREDIRYAILKFLNSHSRIDKSRKMLPILLKDYFGLSDDLVKTRTKKNKALYWNNKIAWGLTALKMAGLINYPKRGDAGITHEGQKFFKELTNTSISEESLSKYPGFISYVDRSKAKSKKVPPSETLVKDTVVDNNQNLIDLLFGLLSNHKVIITIELRKNT